GAQFLVEILLQIDFAVVAETLDTLAVRRVERDQLVARRHIENPLFLAVRPIGQATPGKLTGGGCTALALALAIDPHQFARRAVERHDTATRAGGRIDDAVD